MISRGRTSSRAVFRRVRPARDRRRELVCLATRSPAPNRGAASRRDRPVRAAARGAREFGEPDTMSFAPRFRARTTSRTLGLSLALAALAALAACSSVPRQLAPPRVRMVSLSLLEATVDHQRFAVGLRVENPNAFEIPIKGIEFSARLSGQGVLIGESFEPATLPEQGTEMLDVEVTTEIVSSFASMLSVVQGPENSIPYEINGSLQLESGLDRRVPFSYSGAVPLSQATGAAR